MEAITPALADELATINRFRRTTYCLNMEDLQEGTFTERYDLVLHESVRRRKEERAHAIKETFELFFDDSRATIALAELEEFQLWDAATLPTVLKLGINVRDFSSLRGYPIQRQIHKELVHLVKESVLMQANSTDELVNVVIKNVVLLAQKACHFNQAGDFAAAFDFTDLCWTTNNYLKGAVFGLVEEIKTLGVMPILKGICKEILHFSKNSIALVNALGDAINRPDLALSTLFTKISLLTRELIMPNDVSSARAADDFLGENLN
jgi:hypothetical protein